MVKFVVRNAKREDCVEIRRLIQELADFEKLPNSVKLEAETLEKDGFDNTQPPYQCIVAEDPENPNKLIGYALFFLGYATWLGKRVYLEDIMVTEKYRRSGVGSQLFSRVCEECVKLNCKVLNFVVLDWNPAQEFYKKIGAEDLTNKEGWHFFCLNESKIKEMAKLNT
uniref:Putative diamine acetyltransferase n=1 Tax=Panstrongylus lignarius TaxID=156445 RepID=A0A224XMC8_9HEMI